MAEDPEQLLRRLDGEIAAMDAEMKSTRDTYGGAQAALTAWYPTFRDILSRLGLQSDLAALDGLYRTNRASVTMSSAAEAASLLMFAKTISRRLHTSDFGIPTGPRSAGPQIHLTDSVKQVVWICTRFPAFAKQIGLRARKARKPFAINDEYDVQDAMHALLRMHFDDVRPEDVVPMTAARTTRIDFVLRGERMALEVKHTRQGLTDRKLGDELILDVARYEARADIDCLVCFVFDPDRMLTNPAGLVRDLSRKRNRLIVQVVIAPTH